MLLSFFLVSLTINMITTNKEILICDFNNANNQSACNGEFTHNSNGQTVGVFEYLQSKNYDITDYSSINEVTKNNLSCTIPFLFNGIQNYFCAKSKNMSICTTATEISECNLGKFYGVKATTENVKFNTSWELNSPIMLPSNGNYTLQFYIHYNCYETGPFFPGCLRINDKFTIYKKSFLNETFSVIKEYTYSLMNSNTQWNEYKIDLVLNENSLYLKFSFERITSFSFSSGVFAIDQIKLLHNYPTNIESTIESTTIDIKTSNTFEATSNFVITTNIYDTIESTTNEIQTSNTLKETTNFNINTTIDETTYINEITSQENSLNSTFTSVFTEKNETITTPSDHVINNTKTNLMLESTLLSNNQITMDNKETESTLIVSSTSSNTLASNNVTYGFSTVEVSKSNKPTTTIILPETTISNNNVDTILLAVLIPFGIVLIGTTIGLIYYFCLRKKFTKIKVQNNQNEGEWELK